MYLDTEYSACSAEFSTASPDLLALGLYQIAADAANPNSTAESPATKRLGRCLLFDTAEKSLCVSEVSSTVSGAAPCSSSLGITTLSNEVGRQDMPAVLDMKWCQEVFCVFFVSRADVGEMTGVLYKKRLFLPLRMPKVLSRCIPWPTQLKTR